MEKEKEKEALD
jgi:hypothetical protein